MRRERLLSVMLSLVGTAPFIIFVLHLSVLESSAPSWDLAAEAPTSEESSSSSSSDGGSDDPPPGIKGTIAYAISLTGCGDMGSADMHVQGAAVLGHSIRMNSASNPRSKSRYGYKLIAFVHPDAASCSEPYREVGYEIMVRDTPVNVSDIRGEFLRTHVHKIGCCGEKEYLKLYSYQLTNYPVVVHFDMDCIMLRPLDDLFDVLLEGPNSTAARNVPVMFDAPLPDRIDAFFTRDYNMVKPGKRYPGFQGGFLVVRPNEEVFTEYIDIILEGNFVGGQGWNGTYGGYWGAQQIQGLCSYYYDGLHPGTAVELNRCIYNQMVDSPKKSNKCIDGRDECEDCREASIERIFTAHFTQDCGKPWSCRPDFPRPLCRELVRSWHLYRREWDNATSGHRTIPISTEGKYQPETFQGNCAGSGPRSYIPFQLKSKATRR